MASGGFTMLVLSACRTRIIYGTRRRLVRRIDFQPLPLQEGVDDLSELPAPGGRELPHLFEASPEPAVFDFGGPFVVLQSTTGLRGYPPSVCEYEVYTNPYPAFE